jgi:hypothetical protein
MEGNGLAVIMRYYLGICLEGMKKAMKFLH